MKLVLFYIILIFIPLLPQGGDHQLTLTVTGLKPLKGDLYIGLHNRPEYFQVPDSAFMKMKVAVKSETQMVSFENVPEGRYAIAVYHDENLNGMMDVNNLGIPKEGYGFSSAVTGPGRKKFEQAAFDLNRNDTIEVKMIYHQNPDKKKDSDDN